MCIRVAKVKLELEWAIHELDISSVSYNEVYSILQNKIRRGFLGRSNGILRGSFPFKNNVNNMK